MRFGYVCSLAISFASNAGFQPPWKALVFDAYRYVRSDDHELAFSLTLIKFTYKPVITFIVKRAVPIAERAISIAEDSGIIGIVVPLGIVEHDNLDR